MKRTLRIAVSQLNTITAAIQENLRAILSGISLAHELGADVILFPELSLNGLNCQNLMKNPMFLRETRKAIEEIILYTKGKQSLVVFGFLEEENRQYYDSAGFIQNGKMLGSYRKIYLSTDGSKPENGFFSRGSEAVLIDIEGIKAGVVVGEDMGEGFDLFRLYSQKGANVLFHLSAFPFIAGNLQSKEKRLFARSIDFGVGIVHANAVGGHDQWVFEGNSLIMDAEGSVKARGKILDVDFLVADIELSAAKIVASSDFVNVREIYCDLSASFKPEINPKVMEYPQNRDEEMFLALQLSLRDYVFKNRFEKVVLGLSGGIDSAVVASLATAALGKDKVVGVLMPSKYTSQQSITDAMEMVKKLSIQHYLFPIHPILEEYQKILGSHFSLQPFDLPEQNLQARIRGNFLMDVSNRFGWLVLTTGNKSEIACGYCTLFGDTAGGFALIKDLYKHQVYSLGRYLNQYFGIDVIGENIFQKAPTAELFPGQTDQDSLPPYEWLDAVLKLMVEEGYSTDEVIQAGFEKDWVEKVYHLFLRSEFKRKQSPIGPKLTKVSLNGEQKIPITQRWK